VTSVRRKYRPTTLAACPNSNSVAGNGCPCPITTAQMTTQASTPRRAVYCHSQCGRGWIEVSIWRWRYQYGLPGRPPRSSAHCGRPHFARWIGSRRLSGDCRMGAQLPGPTDRSGRAEDEVEHTAVYPYFNADCRLSYVKVRFTDKQNDKTSDSFGLTFQKGGGSHVDGRQSATALPVNTLASAAEIFIVTAKKPRPRRGRPGITPLHTGRRGQMAGRVHPAAPRESDRASSSTR